MRISNSLVLVFLKTTYSLSILGIPGEDAKIYKGTVVYKFFDKETFEGFWSEKHANQQFLGLERGTKIDGTKIDKKLLQN